MTRREFVGAVLLAIWTRGPLLLEQLHELVPESQPLEMVDALITLRKLHLLHLNDGPVDPLYESGMDEVAARRFYVLLSGERACKVCNCTESWGCAEGCCWAGSELCSACAEDQTDVGTATRPRTYNTERGVINRHLSNVGLE